MMQAFVPAGLASAITVLKQTANPVAPGPGGVPIKSIVGAMVDNAEQAGGIASLGSPPMGDAMPEGTMYGAAENLRNAIPTMQQNAENEMMDRIAQRVRGADAAETGIAPMAGPMNMAEGGIIGYSGLGPQGQLVAPPVPQAPSVEDVMQAATKMSGHIPAASRTEPLRTEFEQMRKNQTDYGAQEVAAIEGRRSKRETESAYERAMAFLAGLGQGGLGGAGTNVMAFNRALRDADEADKMAIIAARKAQDAARKGDLQAAFNMATASDKFDADAARMRTDIITAAERMAQNRYTTEAQLYGAPEKLGIQALQAQAAMMQAQAALRDPEVIRTMTALGYPRTPEGYKKFVQDQYQPRQEMRGAMTYDQAYDNALKFFSANPGEIARIQNEAKKANRPVPSQAELVDAYAQRMLQQDTQRRATPAAGPAAAPPPVGTVMDGYRFKGGDPRDKNNWEKV